MFQSSIESTESRRALFALELPVFFLVVFFAAKEGCGAPAPGRVLGFSAVRVRATVETPSTNLVRNSTLALLNIPSFRDTTINYKGKKNLYFNKQI